MGRDDSCNVTSGSAAERVSGHGAGTGAPDWGMRLADAMRAAIAAGDLASAQRLARQGDGLARDLAREYTFMVHGLGITVRIVLDQVRDLQPTPPAVAQHGAASSDTELVVLLRRLLTGLRASVGACRTSMRSSTEALEGSNAKIPTSQDPTSQHPTPQMLSALAQACSDALADAQTEFVPDQARRAEDVINALVDSDARRACTALDDKDRAYLALHDPLVRFMADGFAWVYRRGGAQALTEFHLATAQAQRAGFEKWERLPTAEFAAVTAFLLRQHMGRVSVEHRDGCFTIRQSPCGSGGRLLADGAYAGPDALPGVDGPAPLTFGMPRMPVYCTHCAIWNGAATLRWFGRVHWVFEQPARADGGCTLHLFERREDTPPDYLRRVSLPAEGGAR